MRTHTEAFRAKIGLPSIGSLFEFGIELTKGVPMGYLWSEALVATPDDWGPHIDVCGTVFDLNDLVGGFTPKPELAAFFAGGTTGSKSQVLERVTYVEAEEDEEGEEEDDEEDDEEVRHGGSVRDF